MCQDKKRVRTRAPVLCLNCKRRKVRCDKGRPCSGCVRNNVGHLCEYVDPKWAGAADAAEGPGEAGRLRALAAELRRQVEAQGRELLCLRARVKGMAVGGLAMTGLAMIGITGNGTPENGMHMTGLSITGLAMTGLAMTGLAMNGIPKNGTTENAMHMAGIHMTGLAVDEMTGNGRHVNGLAVIGIPENGRHMTGLAENGMHMTRLSITGLSITGLAGNDVSREGTSATSINDSATNGIAIKDEEASSTSGTAVTSGPASRATSGPTSGPTSWATSRATSTRAAAPPNGSATPPAEALGLARFMRQCPAASSPITVLAKLGGRSPHAATLVVLPGGLFCVASTEPPPSAAAGVPAAAAPPALFSWLNIIKIDPQLTALWFRITSLQKTYHLYKTALLRNPPPLLPLLLLLLLAMVRTASAGCSENAACGHHQCPVVACEFNHMLEQSELPEPAAAGADSGCGTDNDNDDALRLLGVLQNTWAAVVAQGPGPPMGAAHLSFLVRHYMDAPGPPQTPAESPGLVRYFWPEIRALFSGTGADARLNVGTFGPAMSDGAVLGLLRSKAVYLCMLALVVEETMDLLGLQGHVPAATASEFRALFPPPPASAPSAGRSPPLLRHVLALLRAVLRPLGPLDDMDSLVAVLALMVALLNRLCLLHERKDPQLDTRDAFTQVLVLLLQTLNKQGQPLQVWCDPAQVQLQTPASPGALPALPALRPDTGVLFCRLWHDLLRLVNNVSFHLLPFVKHGSPIDTLLATFLATVPEVEAANWHVAYLASVQERVPSGQIAELIASIQLQHVISRASFLLRNGIHRHFSDGGVAVASFLLVVTELSARCSCADLANIRPVRRVETLTMLHYLEFFFSAVVFLQFEETANTDATARLVPLLFDKFLAINLFWQASALGLAEDAHAAYVWAVVAENLARLSHLVSGLLIRFKPEPKAAGAAASLQGPRVLVYSAARSCGLASSAITIPVEKKEQVIREVDRTVEILEAKMGRESARHRTKIWKFYQTFIRNSHKMNPASYARLHAEALGAGRILDKCPIMSSSGYETSATRMELSRCPVFRTSAGRTSNSRVSASPGCPVSGASSGFMSPLKDVKMEPHLEEPRPSLAGPMARGFSLQAGKCPYGAMGTSSSNSTPALEINERRRKRKWTHGPEPDAIQDTRRETGSLFMGRHAKYTPPLCVPSPSPVPAPSSVMAQPEIDSDTLPQGSFLDMDWESLPDFNFDMMEDENLMVQLNGGDFTNPLIEGLFQ